MKKVTNAIELANLRGTDHLPINMKMLKGVYMETSDMKIDGEYSLLVFVFISVLSLAKLHLLDRRSNNDIPKTQKGNI